MNNYAILRRSGWKSAGDLEEAGARSSKVGEEEMSDDIRWIRTPRECCSSSSTRRRR
jgi:hypothetical protein